ncbi:MAG: thermonuclease family protein [Methylacidiphilales bacterium]|nr:thermonuclease family protein [Candidatus Methylacidiphilales bacterium]
MRLAAFLFLSLAVAITSSGRTEQSSCALPKQALSAKVQRVLDGDTIKLEGGDEVRIIGINAPELQNRYRPEDPGAREASLELTRLLEQSHNSINVIFETKKVDRFGRLLAHVQNNKGENIASKLISQGLVAVAIIPPNSSMADCYLALEQIPRIARKANWAKVTQWHITDSELEEFQGGFAIMYSKVKSIQVVSDQTIYFSLHNGYTLRLKQYDTGYNPEVFLHKKIIARGWINSKKTMRKQLDILDQRLIQLQ